jgi:hypothetical protein
MELDVYGLTRQRDAATLNRFIDEYFDRAANADRGGEELLPEPLDAYAGEMENQQDVEPSLTLAHILELGLAHPRRAFTTYLTCLPTFHQAEIEQVILGFTRDEQLVLGLSLAPIYTSTWDVDEAAEHAQALALLTHLAEAYQCRLGLGLLETPPPLSEAEFRQPIETWRVVFRASFDV